MNPISYDFDCLSFSIIRRSYQFLPHSSYAITKEDIGKRRMTHRRSEKQILRRMSNEENIIYMKRGKSDRVKRGCNNKRKCKEYRRKESAHKVQTIVEVKETISNDKEPEQTIERDKSNETMEISVEDDVLEIVFSREEVRGEQLEHYATVHEAEEKNASNDYTNSIDSSNSIVLCPSNLQIKVAGIDE